LIGWLFVALIGYHAVLAASRAVQAGRDGNWARVATMAAIAIVGSALVIVAVAGAARTRSR
jgi:hypothetical protein